jgi:hypothetical protein
MYVPLIRRSSGRRPIMASQRKYSSHLLAGQAITNATPTQWTGLTFNRRNVVYGTQVEADGPHDTGTSTVDTQSIVSGTVHGFVLAVWYPR